MHRDRVGVVAVVHERDATGELEMLTAKAREGYVRRPTGHRGEVGAERHADRDRRQRVLDVVALGERQDEALLARGRAHRDVRRAPGDLRLERRGRRRPGRTSGRRARRPDAARAPRRRPGRSPGPRARGPPRISAFASAIASSVPSSSRCTGPTLVMTPISGSAISHSSAIWPTPRIAISSTRTSVPGGAPRIVSGRPISVL